MTAFDYLCAQFPEASVFCVDDDHINVRVVSQWWTVSRSATSAMVWGVAPDDDASQIVRFTNLADVCRHISAKEGLL